MDTPYVFLCDMDFLPSKDMAALLATHLDLLKATEEEEEEGNRVLVVPALESEHYRQCFGSGCGSARIRLKKGRPDPDLHI